jgi:hypothetical protein
MKLIAATAIALFLFALASAQVQDQQTIKITRSGTPVLSGDDQSSISF